MLHRYKYDENIRDRFTLSIDLELAEPSLIEGKAQSEPEHIAAEAALLSCQAVLVLKREVEG